MTKFAKAKFLWSDRLFCFISISKFSSFKNPFSKICKTAGNSLNFILSQCSISMPPEKLIKLHPPLVLIFQKLENKLIVNTTFGLFSLPFNAWHCKMNWPVSGQYYINICDTLRNLVPWRSIAFSKVAGKVKMDLLITDNLNFLRECNDKDYYSLILL